MTLPPTAEQLLQALLKVEDAETPEEKAKWTAEAQRLVQILVAPLKVRG